MKRMILFSLLALPLTASLPVHADYLSWGLENWECGVSNFAIQIGGGADIYLNRVANLVSASTLPQAKTSNGYVRQVLASLTYDGANSNLVDLGKVVSSPNHQRFNHEINHNLQVINLKQVGDNVIHIPFDTTYPDSVRIPGGHLILRVETITYTGHGEDMGRALNEPYECLDVEMHLTLYYRRATDQ
jgi:hypothetical protein